jgi:ABC-2 type transport system ATP-binding protein
MSTVASPPAPPLEISGLSKSFPAGFLGRRRVPALAGLDLHVNTGEVFGYLGPNGSGKTTTLKILMGLVSADSGSARILGHPMASPSWRQRVGYLPEHPYFYDYLSPAEYLDYVGRLFGLAPSVRNERSRRLIALVGLERSRHVPMRRFSKGMAQRVGLAQALMNEPELVILDEPMSGLDPIGRRLVRNVILDLKRQGRTIFFSTHILPDAETLCDRVALLRSGSLLKVGRIDEILTQEVSHVEVLLSGGGPLSPLPPGLRSREDLGERCRLEVEEHALLGVLQAASDAGARVLSVAQVRQSLEEYFFAQMGGSDAQGTPWSPED